MGGCFVPGCESGGKKSKNFHLYRAPRRPEIIQKWCEILNKLRSDVQFDNKNPNHRVCSNHFEEKAILKSFRYVINGEVVERERERWTLADDAIPTIFDCLPESVRPKVKAPRRKIVKVKSTPNKKQKTVTDATPFTETAIKVKPGTEQGPDPLSIPEPPIPCYYSYLLQKFCEGSSNAWIFKKFDKYSSAVQLMDENGMPFVYRTITKPAKGTGMNFRFTISGCDVTSEVLNGEDLTEDNFEAIATRFNLIHKCRGLPGFDNIDECSSGVKRAGKWYSVECAGLGVAVVCVKCKLLHRTLTLKNRKQNLTPHTNKVDRVKVLRENQKNLLRKIRYYKGRIKTITQRRKDLQKKLCSVKYEVREAHFEKVRESLSNMDIPEGVKEKIIKSLTPAKPRSSSPKEMEIETDDDDNNESESISPSEESECSD